MVENKKKNNILEIILIVLLGILLNSFILLFPNILENIQMNNQVERNDKIYKKVFADYNKAVKVEVGDDPTAIAEKNAYVARIYLEDVKEYQKEVHENKSVYKDKLKEANAAYQETLNQLYK